MDAEESRKERRRQRRRVAERDRKRAPRACERCKRRKNRCIETSSGTCQRCQEGAHRCTFSDEKGDIDTVAEDAEGLRHVRDAAVRPAPRVSLTPIPQEQQPWRSMQQDAFAIDGTLASSESFRWSSFLGRLRETFYLGAQPALSERGTTRPTVPGSSSGPGTPSPAEARRLQQAIASFPPPDIAKFLVAVSIQHGTDSFCYLDQAQFVAELDHFYEDASSRLRNDAGFICLALAVFALGSQWTTLAKPESRVPDFLPKDRDPGRIFYNQARVVMGDILDSMSIRSVQAAFVLGVYLMPASAIGASYVYMGLALRKALALDLHQNTHDPGIGTREQELRRRLWWAIYSLERTLTIKLNRPSSINQTIIGISLPQPCEELDSVQTFNNVHHQIANARLVLILDRLSEPMTWSDEQATKCELELKEWKRNLPPALRPKSIHPKLSEYRAAVHLYLNYYSGWIAMGKVSLLTVVRSHLHRAFRPEEALPPVDGVLERLSRSCINAAVKTLKLFEGLTRTGNLTRFSFTDFQGCSLATTILLVAGIVDGEGEVSSKASFGLDCLRRMTGGNSTAVMGVRFVEALQCIAQEATAKLAALNTSRSTAESIEDASEPSDYSRWAQWLTSATTMETEERRLSKQLLASPGAVVGGGSRSVRAAFAGQFEGQDMVQATSEWERAAAIELEQMPPQGFAGPGEFAPRRLDGEPPGGSPVLAADFQSSSIYGDDHMYLLGLTGLDMLNLTENLT